MATLQQGDDEEFDRIWLVDEEDRVEVESGDRAEEPRNRLPKKFDVLCPAELVQEIILSDSTNGTQFDEIVLEMMKREIAEILDKIVCSINQYHQQQFPTTSQLTPSDTLQIPPISQIIDLLFYRFVAEISLREYSFFQGNRTTEFYLYLSTIALLSVKQWSFDELSDPSIEAHT